MKQYKTESGDFIVRGTEENGKYIVTTRYWMSRKKSFDTMEEANEYFRRIKRKHPTLKED